MVRGAAGDEEDALDAPDRGAVERHLGQHDRARLGRDAAAERVGDGARLLVDLLEHEVPVAALLRHDRIPEDPRGVARHRSPASVETSTPCAVTTAMSPSSRITTSRVCARIAGMSDAMNISS